MLRGRIVSWSANSIRLFSSTKTYKGAILAGKRPKVHSNIASAYWDAKEELMRREHHREQSPGAHDAAADLGAFEMLANQRIRESMQNGDFDNLPENT